MRGLRKRHGCSRLPRGQRTYTIKIRGGRYAGEYSGETTVNATAQKARKEFVPHVEQHAEVDVVHFDRDGERTIHDKTVKAAYYGGPYGGEP